MANTSFVIQNDLIDKIKPTVDKRTTELIKHMSKYISKVSPALSEPGPSERVIYTKKDQREFFEASNIKESVVRKVINDCPAIESNWEVRSNPLNILSISLIVESFQNKRVYSAKKLELSKLISFYLSIRLYSSIQQHMFPYDPNKQVMDATIETLSNRYSIKKANNVFEVIKDISNTSMDSFVDRLMKPATDEDITRYLTNLLGRIKSFVKNVAKEFYKNVEEGKTSRIDKLELEGDDGDYLNDDISNASTEVLSATRKVVNRLYSESYVDARLMKAAAKRTGVSASKMSVSVKLMLDEEDHNLENLIVDVISYYLIKFGKKMSDLKNKYFIKSMINVYSHSNTKDKRVIKIKNILDLLLTKYSKEYIKTSRVATLSNMKACLYNYFVFFIADTVN